MITLSDDQEDGLIEICNVGMSKAAKQLSILLNCHIDISIPAISISTFESISRNEKFNSDHTLAYVYQNVTKSISGRALLVFQREQTRLLTHSVIGNVPNLSEKEIRACEQEAMIEIGNIIISACISSIANMLSIAVQLDVPSYAEHNIKEIVKIHSNQIFENSISNGRAITISTQLETTNKDISGSLILVLDEDSINTLVDSLKKLVGE